MFIISCFLVFFFGVSDYFGSWLVPYRQYSSSKFPSFYSPRSGAQTGPKPRTPSRDTWGRSITSDGRPPAADLTTRIRRFIWPRGGGGINNNHDIYLVLYWMFLLSVWDLITKFAALLGHVGGWVWCTQWSWSVLTNLQYGSPRKTCWSRLIPVTVYLVENSVCIGYSWWISQPKFAAWGWGDYKYHIICIISICSFRILSIYHSWLGIEPTTHYFLDAHLTARFGSGILKQATAFKCSKTWVVGGGGG